jgi:hypothetical protein
MSCLGRLWGKIVSWFNRHKKNPKRVNNLTVEIDYGTSNP